MKHFPAVAVVGATGLVGSVLLSLFEGRDIFPEKLFLLASDRSAGETLTWLGREILVGSVSQFDFSQTRLCFFCAGERVSADYAERAEAAGNIVIDKSALFRLHPDIPLVVPEVNGDSLISRRRNIIASPNCTTIPLVMALKPLFDAVGMARINVATYQSVSGSGREGIRELGEQSEKLLQGKSVMPHVYSQQVAFNVLPQIDVLADNGYTHEEMKLMLETGRILGDPSLQVNATAVRVPVFYGHGAAVHAETREKLSREAALQLLSAAPGIRLVPSPGFPTPVNDAAGRDDVSVGRVREDPSHPHGLSFWVVGDNVRKGAALNALQIAEKLFALESN